MLLGAFEQRRSAPTVVGDQHVQVVVAAQAEAAKDGPRAIGDLHLDLADLQAERKQRLLGALPLPGCKRALFTISSILREQSPDLALPQSPPAAPSALSPAVLLLWSFLYLCLRCSATT